MRLQQTMWRQCAKCHAMSYNGLDARGSCPGDGAEHEPIGLNFQLPYGDPVSHPQRNWRFCRRCFVLFWDQAARQVCNRGGRHVPDGPAFTLPRDLPETAEAQSGWRCCARCANLWRPAARVSRCSAGGEHASTGAVFTVPHRADHVYDSGPVASDVALHGWAQFSARPDGAWTLSTHVHRSGTGAINYALGVVLLNRYGNPIALARSGSVAGTNARLPGGSALRGDNQTSAGSAAVVREQYDHVADADLRCLLVERAAFSDGVSVWLSGFAGQLLSEIGKAAEAAILEIT